MEIITADMKKVLVADAYLGRVHEVQSYQLNIDNYTAMLVDLPQDAWPAEMVQYKDIDPAKIDPDVSLDDMVIISDYQFRDRVRILLRTEHVEMSKTARIMNALDGQLSASSKEADVTAAVTRRAAVLAKAE